MSVIVVGGSGRNVGKTSLVCGLIVALPEFQWTAVKVTSHEHDAPQPVWEEFEAGQDTDTARYLAAGAQRAFLMSATDAELDGRLRALQATLSEPSHLIFESNRIVEWIQPDVCLAAQGADVRLAKPSWARLAQRADATIVLADHDEMTSDPSPVFRLADLARVSPPMRQWLRERLA
jgi:hypothetical protein